MVFGVGESKNGIRFKPGYMQIGENSKFFTFFFFQKYEFTTRDSVAQKIVVPQSKFRFEICIGKRRKSSKTYSKI